MSKARRITFDCETYQTRNPEIVDRITRQALEKQPAQNTAKDIKTEWNTTAAREARVREVLNKTAVDVLIAEILCACWRADGEPYSVQGMFDGTEKSQLEKLAEELEEQSNANTIWVGHNIAGFDLAILLNGWRRNGLRPPTHFPEFINGRWRGRVYDTMHRIPCANGLGLVSLKDACSAYRLTCPKGTLWKDEPMNGSRVAEAFEAGEYDLILEYCDEDVVINDLLYLHITGNDTHSTFDRPDGLAAAIAEIRASDMPEGAKAVSINKLLDDAGLIPYVA